MLLRCSVFFMQSECHRSAAARCPHPRVAAHLL